MLGIIIGVAAVIILVTPGSSATRRVTEQIASLGSNLLMVSPGKRMGPGQSSGAAPFKLADAEAIARDVPSLAAVAPIAARSTTAIYANENWATSVTGTTEQNFTLSNQRIHDGRVFTASETRLGSAVCVVGETVRNKLFGGLIGIALALVSSSLLAGVLQAPFVFNVPIVMIGFAFSATMGVVFGYVPARKAARLDPIEALRHE
jgi:ABC-type antimicrobial peptide transport system permease subunit